MRVIGLDLGERRIGVAVSDTAQTIASPHSYIEVPKADTPRQILKQKLPALVAELEAEAVVVGLPLSLSGELGPAAQAAQSVCEALAELLDIPVLSHDERLTSAIADRALKQTKLSGRKRRAKIDKVAAAVMLQSWLDAR